MTVATTPPYLIPSGNAPRSFAVSAGPTARQTGSVSSASTPVVFTRSQCQARYSVTAGPATRFVRALVDAGVVREAGRVGGHGYRPTSICQVHGRSLYRALRVEDDRHRRSASPELTMRRLLSLDYVLERPEFGWLATEPEKLAYFQRLGISLAVLPHRLHRGPSADRPTRRYFPLKFAVAGSGTTTTADPGGRRRLQSDRIGSWVGARAPRASLRSRSTAHGQVRVSQRYERPPAPRQVRRRDQGRQGLSSHPGPREGRA